MSLSTFVPADVEPECVVDMIEDCREVTGVLGSFLPMAVRLPAARHPDQLDASVAGLLEGYGDYGS